jgi:hypothetical protein
MAFIPKARDLQQNLTGDTIRLAQRESFDTKTATRAPSATGGAPRQTSRANEPVLNNEVKMPTIPTTQLGYPSIPTPRGQTPGEQEFWRVRRVEGLANQAIIPNLLQSSRSIEDYTVANQEFVNELTQALDEYAGQDPAWAERVGAVGGANEFARRMVAQVSRAFELESTGLALPDQINSTRNGREVRAILENIRARRGLR